MEHEEAWEVQMTFLDGSTEEEESTVWPVGESAATSHPLLGGKQLHLLRHISASKPHGTLWVEKGDAHLSRLCLCSCASEICNDFLLPSPFVSCH